VGRGAPGGVPGPAGRAPEARGAPQALPVALQEGRMRALEAKRRATLALLSVLSLG